MNRLGEVYSFRNQDGNLGKGVFDPEKVYWEESDDGDVVIDGYRCRLLDGHPMSPVLPANTLRFRFGDRSYNPETAGVGSSGTWTRATRTPYNEWDWHCDSASWATAFGGGGTGIPGAFDDINGNPVDLVAAGDTSGVTDFSRFFQNCRGLRHMCKLDTSGAHTVTIMFSHCENLEDFWDMDLTGVNVSSGTTAIFQHCYKMKRTPALKLPNIACSLQNLFLACGGITYITWFDTSKVTNMRSMLSMVQYTPVIGDNETYTCTTVGCNAEELPLFDTTNVTTMQEMLAYTGIKRIPELNFGKVTSLKAFATGCLNLESAPDIVALATTTVDGAFSRCPKLMKAPNVTVGKNCNMDNLFFGGRNLATINGQQWAFPVTGMYFDNVPEISWQYTTSAEQMFTRCVNLPEVPDLTNIGSIANCRAMFYHCYNVAGGAKAAYDILSQKSSITDHQACFGDCGINTPRGRDELSQIPDDWGGTQQEVTIGEKSYKTVRIGDYLVMAEDLDYEATGITVDTADHATDQPALWHIDDKPYYNAFAIDAINAAAPTGWHVPSQTEVVELFNSVISDYNASGVVGKLMKTASWGGNNATGFTWLNLGMSIPPDGDVSTTTNGVIWTSTEYDATNQVLMYATTSSNAADLYKTDKTVAVQVRLIKKL